MFDVLLYFNLLCFMVVFRPIYSWVSAVRVDSAQPRDAWRVRSGSCVGYLARPAWRQCSVMLLSAFHLECSGVRGPE